MATDAIEQSVKDITGSLTLNTYSIADAQKFVVSKMPKNLLSFAQKSSSSSTNGDAISFYISDLIIDVQRNGYSCSEIPLKESVWALDPLSLKKATVKHPKFYHKDGKVHFAPITDEDSAGIVFYIDYSKIDDDSDLRNAVIYNAASAEFEKLSNSKIVDWEELSVPIAPNSPDFGNDLSISLSAPSVPILSDNTVSFSESVPSYSKPVLSVPTLGSISSLTLPSVPNPPVMGSERAVTFEEGAPSYTKPSLVLRTAPSISDLTISAEIPVQPPSPCLSEIATIAYLASQGDFEQGGGSGGYSQGTAGEYAESVNATGADWDNMLGGLTAPIYNPPTPPNLDDLNVDDLNVPMYIPPEAPKYDEYMSDEDSELAQIELAKYQQDIVNEQNRYNQQNERFKKETEAQLSEVLLNKYQKDIDNELNKYNQQNASYQREVEAKLLWYASVAKKGTTSRPSAGSSGGGSVTGVSDGVADASSKTSIASAQFKLNKDVEEFKGRVSIYQQDIQLYQQEVASEVQAYQQNLAGDLQVWQSERQTDIQKYGIDVQNELNEFNKEVANFQAELQVSLKNADLDDGRDKIILQKYQNEISAYQQEVTATIQKWTAEEWTQNFQKYQIDYTSLLQSYQADIQNELNEFNNENIAYQSQLQISLQDAQLSSQDDAQKIQKYGAEVGTYQQDINKEVQNFVNTLQKESQEYQNTISLYSAEVQSFQSNIASKTQKSTSGTQNAAYYSGEAKKYYDWSINEINSYIQNNETMINRTITANARAQAAQQQGYRR